MKVTKIYTFTETELLLLKARVQAMFGPMIADICDAIKNERDICQLALDYSNAINDMFIQSVGEDNENEEMEEDDD